MSENKHHWDGANAKSARKNLDPIVFFSHLHNRFVRCSNGQRPEFLS